MAVIEPLKLVIENYPEGQVEAFEFPNHPERPELGSRTVPFSRELWVERDDFREDPPRKWQRLAPGREVRLRYAYYVTCNEVVKNAQGEAVELRCSYDPESRGGSTPDGRKVKGALHWVSAAHARDAEVRLYEPLFAMENPMAGDGDFLSKVNPDSLKTLTGCKVEPALAGLAPEDRVQFERLGYFCADWRDYAADTPVFNRTATLRDSWARIERSGNS